MGDGVERHTNGPGLTGTLTGRDVLHRCEAAHLRVAPGFRLPSSKSRGGRARVRGCSVEGQARLGVYERAFLPASIQLVRWCGSAVAQCRNELSALFERESRARSSVDRAADFGPSWPVRCAIERGRGSVLGRVICCRFGSCEARIPPRHMLGRTRGAESRRTAQAAVACLADGDDSRDSLISFPPTERWKTIRAKMTTTAISETWTRRTPAAAVPAASSSMPTRP